MPQVSDEFYQRMEAEARATFSCVGEFHRGKVEATAKNILIFKFGKSLDVSVLSIDIGVFEVRASAGNKHLGGEHFDRRMADFLTQEYKSRHSNDLPTSDKLFVDECRCAKEKLSRDRGTSVPIMDRSNKYTGIGLYITRAEFEELCADLFQSTLNTVKQALRDAKIDKGDIHEIVLVGFSTRIPAIQKLLVDFFSDKELTGMSIDRHEAVATGAAEQVKNAIDDKSECLKSLKFILTSLGRELEFEIGGVMTANIESTIITPTQRSPIVSYGSGVVIKMLGERAMRNDNIWLGNFNLYHIPPFHEPSESERLEKEAYAEKAREEERYELESYTFKMMDFAEKLEAKTREVMAWIHGNPSAEADEFTNKRFRLEDFVESRANRWY